MILNWMKKIFNKLFTMETKPKKTAKKSIIKYDKIDYIFRYLNNDLVREKALIENLPLYITKDVAKYIISSKNKEIELNDKINELQKTVKQLEKKLKTNNE